MFQNKVEILFRYNLNTSKKNHYINNINFLTKNDNLNQMINKILSNKINIKINNEKALFIVKFLNIIKTKINNLTK